MARAYRLTGNAYKTYWNGIFTQTAKPYGRFSQNTEILLML